MASRLRRVHAEIGRGSTGRVHAADDESLRRRIAVKRLDPELAKDAFYRNSFITEALINGQLEHPNIVPVYQLASDDDGVPYFTTKLVDGVSLVHWLRDPERPPGSQDRLDEGLEILLKVCDAVAYAHHRGILHLDVKPDNIMVGAFGQVYLLDWSVARASIPEHPDDEPEAVGTPGYLAPEQARGSPAEIGQHSDVFGLGAVLYEIVSGKAPYGDHRGSEMLLRQARLGSVVPIEQAVAGLLVPKRLRDIVRRATAPSPAERYATAVEFAREVLTFARGRVEP